MSTALAKIGMRVINEPTEVIIGRHTQRHERAMSRLEKLLQKLPPGRTYLQTVTMMERLENEFVELQMSMGVISRAAQLHTVTNYQFSSSISLIPEHQRNRSVDMFEAPVRTIRGELVE